MAKAKIYAKTKYVGMSPQKVRLVVDLVRGKNAMYASEMLDFVQKAANLPVKKTIESAIANAVNNFDLNKKELKIVEARVDEAPTFKRGRAVSKGRYHKILKRNCHIIIAVSDGSDEKDVKSIDSKVKKAKGSSIERSKKKDDVKGKGRERSIDGRSKQKVGEQKMVKLNQVKQVSTPRKVQAKG